MQLTLDNLGLIKMSDIESVRRIRAGQLATSWHPSPDRKNAFSVTLKASSFNPILTFYESYSLNLSLYDKDS